jgi:hypothetical protein
VRALRYGECHHSINTQRRQQQRSRRKAREEHQRKAIVGHIVMHLFHGARLRQRNIGSSVSAMPSRPKCYTL